MDHQILHSRHALYRPALELHTLGGICQDPLRLLFLEKQRSGNCCFRGGKFGKRKTSNTFLKYGMQFKKNISQGTRVVDVPLFEGLDRPRR
jgi:hypothetical protein